MVGKLNAVRLGIMAGGTHVFDMIKRLRENENLRRLSYFKTRKSYNPTTGGMATDNRTFTTGEWHSGKYSIKKDQRTEMLRVILALGIAILLCGALILFLLKFIRQ